ncbi:hypothetical protein LguiA_023203 [Lonicera macranthoides]
MAGSSLNLFWFTLFSILIISTAIDTIEPTQLIRDGETIVSAGEKFQLGFFSPNNSQNRYVAIWFNKISVQTTVWVANRETPLTDSSGILTVTNQGSLAVLNSNESSIWSSNTTRSTQDPIAQLLDSGNLVLRERNDTNPENYLWQSFDYPCDTLLAGMKLGRSNVTGIDRYLSSWKSNSDPSRGNFTFQLDSRGFPQLVMMKGPVVHYASGPWNGLRFSGSPNLKPNPYYEFYFIFNQEEVYYAYRLLDRAVVTRLGIDLSGYVKRFIWNNQTRNWDPYPSIEIDVCDNYAFCGEFSSCNIDNTPQCGCLKGFVPKKEWEAQDWTHGCARKTVLNLDCKTGVSFYKYSGIKLPDTQSSWFDRTMPLEDCKLACLNNCTCTAYTSLNISNGGSGCLVWFGELFNIREYPENGQTIYLRIASSDMDGQEIAVKKLSKSSRQGIDEFKNEVLCIAKLQHRNLVKLLGCCIHMEKIGYMSPEYAIDGLFSVKSDVFSFGVLVLEIVSGKKNRGFNHQEHCLNLLGHAWVLHNEGRSLELVNECLRDSCNLFEVLRSIHVGLLCVQQSPEDRPSMSTVVLMLSSDSALPQPKQPGFFSERNIFEGNSSQYDSVSANEMTNTTVAPR